MEFTELERDNGQIAEMSAMATEIVREHFDPIIGKAQNDYMIGKFQSEAAIQEMLEHGYRYFFVEEAGRRVGFLTVCPKADVLYLSKFYLYKGERGKGYAHKMLDFVVEKAREYGLPAVELNVNRNNDAILAYDKMGFYVAREEKNDIGQGFYMDDFVYRLDVE